MQGWGELSEIPLTNNCLKQKRREGKQIFQKGGKLGQWVGALKKWGAETPLQTMIM